MPRFEYENANRILIVRERRPSADSCSHNAAYTPSQLTEERFRLIVEDFSQRLSREFGHRGQELQGAIYLELTYERLLFIRDLECLGTIYYTL